MSRTPFSSVLVANRGEIARRVLRTLRNEGYLAIAVFSEADAGAPYLRDADLAVPLGPAAARDSYLSIDRLLAAARKAGAEAIHPGYGFLAENAAFAAACREAGLVFIGPSAEAIATMGDKTAARARMAAAGVPCVPGATLEEGLPDSELLARAAGVGYPVMIKAAAGGGGRGMRRVGGPADFLAAYRSARSEAANAFGDGRVYLERAIEPARHIEVQILGDRYGGVVHLGERDCSVQRRHQKVVEETPSPAVDPELRARLGQAAVAAAASVSYEGAGTVEFIMGPDGDFYFIEMNTRLQVEHPVTEMVSGLDIVALQLRLAAGEPLPFRQDEVTLKGHAIEVRLCAEDPAQGFLPQTGRVLAWRAPERAGVRVDAALAAGQEITAHYDSMLAKLVAHGRDREEARRRLAAALRDTVLLGVATNKTLLQRVLADDTFVAGGATTGLLDSFALADGPDPLLAAVAALVVCWPGGEAPEAWRRAGPGRWTVAFESGPVRIRRLRGGRVEAEAGGSALLLDVEAFDGATLVCLADGVLRRFQVACDEAGVHVDGGTAAQGFRHAMAGRERPADDGDGRVLAPLSGRLLKLGLAIGERVARGQVACVIEAMKMEMQVRAAVAGEVLRIAVVEGQQVSARQLLVEIRPDAPPAEGAP